MKTVTRFPKATQLLDPVFVTMTDGVKLAAKIWLPLDAESNHVPAILEYLPYRRTDGTAARDETTHPYFAGHGYACIRVDMRGSGDSEGIMRGEYLKQEQDDALESDRVDFIAVVVRREHWNDWHFMGWVQRTPGCRAQSRPA